MPEAAIPNRPNTQPPKTPPIIPKIKLIITPKPPPRIILPARKPATIPIRMYHKNPIAFKFYIIRIYNCLQRNKVVVEDYFLLMRICFVKRLVISEKRISLQQ